MNFKYEIANMDVVGDEAIVIKLHYRVSAQKDGCDLIPVRSGVVELDAPNEEFVEFEDITKELALTWLKEKLLCAEIEQSLTEEIDAFRPTADQPIASKTPSSWTS